MATRKETVDYILDQLDPLRVRMRAMFGEYAMYCAVPGDHLENREWFQELVQRTADVVPHPKPKKPKAPKS